MRKLILATAIILLSSSAFAGPRGLSSPQAAEPQKPFHQAEVTVLPAPAEQPAANVEAPLRVEVPPLTVEEKLKAAGELKSDGTPVARPAEAAPVRAKPVEAQAPVQVPPAATPVEAKAPVQAQPEQKPVKTRVVKKHESDEQKARRIAARYGISW